MWVFLSRRIRMGALLAIALPAARFVVRRLASAGRRRNPDARTTRLLDGADSALTSVAKRADRRRKP